MESDHVTVAYETSERSSASVFVAKQMAKYKDTSPEELTPLAEVIDADAIDTLFGGPDQREPTLNEGELTFRWENTLVTLRTDSTVEIKPAPESTTTAPL